MRLQNYLTEAFNVAFFISPRGEIVGTPQTHIQQVITNPEKFGFNDGIIDHIYNFYGEKKGLEGKAREQILISLLNQGWIRLRRSKNFWTAQLKKLDGRSRKHLSKWAGALLDGKLGVNEIDPYIELKIIDIKGKMESSGLKQLQALAEGVDVSEIRVYEITELEDRPVEYITELFDKMVDVRVDVEKRNEFISYFQTSAHEFYFQADLIESDYGNRWIVTFSRYGGGAIGHQYNTLSDLDTKEALEVFSGVRKSLELFLDKYKPKVFVFEAEDDSHRKVYEKMAEQIKKRYGYRGQIRKVGGSRWDFDFFKREEE